jgi:hypothetical protein
MPKPDGVSINSHDICQSIDSTWDKAIVDATSELADAEHRVSRLRNALRIFKENKVKGVPWPGAEIQKSSESGELS